jgi:hypothetical protein
MNFLFYNGIFLVKIQVVYADNKIQNRKKYMWKFLKKCKVIHPLYLK